jgi:hypothetical protein
MNQWKEKLTYYFYDSLRIIQSWLLKISLFFVYFFAIGFSKILVTIFASKHMAPFRVKKSQPTYWVDAKKHNNFDQEQHQRQV